MELYIAGINHFDPLCREELIKWFKELSAIKDKPAAFIAVEYDADQFEQIKKQRNKFRELAQDEWPCLSSGELDILENSLAYEGDVHREVLPDAKILWLDQGRQDNYSERIDHHYAEERLRLYKGYSPATEPSRSLNNLTF